MEPTPTQKAILPFILTQKQASSSSQDNQEIPNDARFTANIAGKMAQGCHDIFFPEFKPKILPNDACFFAFEKGLEVEGEKPDYVLTLGQKHGKMKIPLIIFHEQIPVERLNDTTLQLSSYAKKILEDDFYVNNQAFAFKHVFIVLLFPKTLEFRFVKYTIPGKNQTLADLVEYTGQCPLSKNNTNKLDVEKLRDLFTIVLQNTYLQLDALNLFDEKLVPK